MRKISIATILCFVLGKKACYFEMKREKNDTNGLQLQ